MVISGVIAKLESLRDEHGDVDVYAYPGWDTGYPVTSESIEFYSTEISEVAHVLITGVPDSEDSMPVSPIAR